MSNSCQHSINFSNSAIDTAKFFFNIVPLTQAFLRRRKQVDQNRFCRDTNRSVSENVAVVVVVVAVVVVAVVVVAAAALVVVFHLMHNRVSCIIHCLSETKTRPPPTCKSSA